jgi:hypothetical protein
MMANDDDRTRRPSDTACGLAIAELTRRALTRSSELPDDVAEHLVRCPACRARLDQLARAVLSGRADDIPCAECHVWLDRYVADEVAGADVASSLPLVHAHLARCSDCAETAGVLRLVLRDPVVGEAPVPPGVPVFDLYFLLAAPGGDREAVDWPVVARASAVARAWAVRARAAAAGVAGAWRSWADTRGRSDDRSDRLTPLRSVGVLAPVVAVLLVALGLLWTAMHTAPIAPLLATARQTAAARRVAATATAHAVGTGTSAAEATARAIASPTARPGGTEGTGRAGVGAVRGTPSPAGIPGAPVSPTVEAAPATPRGGRRHATPTPAATVVPAVDPGASTPDNAIETAYPVAPTEPAPPGYPPPADIIPRKTTTAPAPSPWPVPTRPSPGPPGER